MKTISRTATLAELCVFRHGGTPSKANPTYWGGDIPWISPKDMKSSLLISSQDSVTPLGVEESATSVVPEGSILVVARSGILAHTLPVAQVGTPVAFNQDIKAIQVASASVSPDYVYWFLRSQESDVLRRGVKKGATVHSLQSGFLENLRIPLLPLPEQRRIVDLLSRAENIVRMRREAEAKAKEIIPALFMDMFGDPALNPKEWPVKPLGQLINRFEGGKNVQAGSEAPEALRILKISAVTSGEYDESQAKPAPLDWDPPSHYFVREGDLLFSRANTADLVGATAIVRHTDGRRLLPDKLWRLVCREPSLVHAEFLLALLQNASLRIALSKLASGTGGAMKNISQEKLRALPLPVPPLERQKEFALRATRLDDMCRDGRRATCLAEQALAALLSQAFQGAT